MQILPFFFFIFFLANSAFTQDYEMCDTIFRASEYGCDNLSASNTMGGSYTTIFDAIDNNPASIPIYETPFGVEYTSTDGKNNFALIKGQEQFGAGVSAKNSSSTFYGPTENYKSAIKQKYGEKIFQPRSLDPNINLSTALNLIRLDALTLPIGLGFKFNPEVKSWSPTVGFGFKTKYFNVGASSYQETPQPTKDDSYKTTEKNHVSTGTLGIKIENFLLDYTYFSQKNVTKYETINTTFGTAEFKTDYQVSTQLLSATYVWKMISLSYGYRKQNDSRVKKGDAINIFDDLRAGYQKVHQLFGINLRLGDWLRLGYFYNYELNNGSTMVAQVFF